ncbi:MAG: sigma-70 family RNA polymerase sigma factor [Spirochaetaceae bacterium]|nr:sigma-70 family RNA polymerase sigma factor [Spirochaetaceae bacterium]
MNTEKTFDDGMITYFNEVNKIPLLSREEEFELTTRAKVGDKAARAKVVSANLRFVISVAKRYQHQGLDLQDLISEGNVGLLVAIDRFEPKLGYHFISYAVWWIRQSILKALAEKSRTIRLPANRINEILLIQKARQNTDALGGEDEIRSLCEELGMDEDKVREILAIERETVSLDCPTGHDEEVAQLQDFISDDKNQSPEDEAIYSDLKEELSRVLLTLPAKEAQVLRYHFGLEGNDTLSLRELGERFHLTKERIRQIEKKALKRLREPELQGNLHTYVA